MGNNLHRAYAEAARDEAAIQAEEAERYVDTPPAEPSWRVAVLIAGLVVVPLGTLACLIWVACP